jgi:hypothetical protein
MSRTGRIMVRVRLLSAAFCAMALASIASGYAAECAVKRGISGDAAIADADGLARALRGDAEFRAVAAWIGDNQLHRVMSYRPPGPPRPQARPPVVSRMPIEATDASGQPLSETLDAIAALSPRADAKAALLARMSAVEGQGGFRKRNLAAAAAFMIMTAENVASGGQASLENGEGLLLTTAVNDALARAPAFMEMTSARRAAAYEAIVGCTSLLLIEAYDAVVGEDATAMRSAQGEARAILARSGW